MAFGLAALDVLLTEAGVPWLIPFLSAYEAKFINTSTFCAVDPPTIVALTPTDLINLATPLGGGDLAGALSKVDAIVQNILWYAFCKCDVGAQPVQPSPITTQPTGAPVVSIPNSGPYKVAAVQNTSTPGNEPWNVFEFVWETPGALVQTDTLAYRWNVGQGTTTVALLPIRNGFSGAIARIYNHDLSFSLVFGGTTEDCSDETITAVQLTMSTLPYDGSKTPSTLVTSYYRGLPTAAPVTQGEATDPLIAAKIQSIYDIVRAMQRYRVPFATITGTAHVGLTGSGTVPVTSICGVRVSVTAFPGTNQQLPGNPPYIKDLGWMSVDDGGGMLQEKRITQQTFEWYPPQCQLATSLNYDFFPGVTVTLTELLPEP